MDYLTSERTEEDIDELAKATFSVITKITKKTENFPKRFFMTFEWMIEFMGFVLNIVDDRDLPNSYAEVRPFEKMVIIRESVYTGALLGKYNDLFIAIHEFAHFLLHNKNIAFCTKSEKGNHNKRADPEWQADFFAEKLLSYGYREYIQKDSSSRL